MGLTVASRTPPPPSECNYNCKSICKLNFGTLPPPGECYCNCKTINWTETLPSSKSRDTKTRTYIKNLLRTKVRYCSKVSESVVICQLTLKMPEEIDFENWRISNYRRASLIDLYLHTKFHRNRKNFLWTDRHLRPTLLGWLYEVDLKMTYYTQISKFNSFFLRIK